MLAAEVSTPSNTNSSTISGLYKTVQPPSVRRRSSRGLSGTAFATAKTGAAHLTRPNERIVPDISADRNRQPGPAGPVGPANVFLHWPPAHVETLEGNLRMANMGRKAVPLEPCCPTALAANHQAHVHPPPGATVSAIFIKFAWFIAQQLCGVEERRCELEFQSRSLVVWLSRCVDKQRQQLRDKDVREGRLPQACDKTVNSEILYQLLRHNITKERKLSINQLQRSLRAGSRWHLLMENFGLGVLLLPFFAFRFPWYIYEHPAYPIPLFLFLFFIRILFFCPCFRVFCFC